MRQTRFILILALLIAQMSCIEKKARRTGEVDPAMQSLEGPRVIRDTIIQIVLRDTIDSRKQEVAVVEPAKPTRSTGKSTTRHNDGNDSFDRSNSGFFDSYKSNYQGDPNRNLQPTVHTVKSNVDDVTRQKEAIERELELLEKRNEMQQSAQQRMNQNIQQYNDKAIQEAKQQQEQEQEQQKQKQATPKGKTLDTDLLLNKR